MASIAEFVEKYKDRFDLSDLSDSERSLLVAAVFEALQAENPQPSQSTQTFSALNSIRILSRAKAYINSWMNDELFELLMLHSALVHYKDSGKSVIIPDNINTELVTEATKCLCNLTFNSPKVQSMCEREDCVLALIQRAKTYSDPSLHHSIKYFDMRLMFIITALVKATRTRATLEWDGISVLSDVIHQILGSDSQKKLADDESDLIIEVLKTLYNLTLVISPWSEEFTPFDRDLLQLVSRVHRLISRGCVTKEKHLDIIKHCSNLFTALPKAVTDSFVPELDPSVESPTILRSFQGHDVSSISEILRYLEMVLEETTLATLKDQLLPVLTTLTSLSRSNRIIRKYCRLRILPHLRDEVKRLPEEGDSLRNRLCKLLTTPNTQVKQMVADLLYVICKENVSRLIKYSGFGNAAGLLAQYGLMGGTKSTPGNYSEDSDSETEEYKELEPDINPVTGRYETERVDPMQGMTDDQKEYEALQLINAMDKLQRLGIVQPSTIGPDGKPTPVEHVLQLARDPQSDEEED